MDEEQSTRACPAPGTIMTTINWRLSSVELEARYEGAADPIGKSHFHALWLLSSGYGLRRWRTFSLS